MDLKTSKLIEANVPLARFLARKMWERAPNVLDYEEVTSMAYQGLVTAALRWAPEGRNIDPAEIENGKAFAGFARQRILGQIMDYLRDLDHVQRSYRNDYKILVRAGYPGSFGQELTAEALSGITGLSVHRIHVVVRAVETPPVSLEGTFEGSSEEPSDSIDVESSALVSTLKNATADAVNSLPPLHQVVIALRYIESMEMQAIASELGVSLSTVRDSHDVAIKHVHDALLQIAEEKI